MCIYSPNEATLQALRGSNIELMMDVVGETLQSLTDPNVATDWSHFFPTCTLTSLMLMINKALVLPIYTLITQQGTNNFGYQNLFDAMLDSKYTALEKMGAPNLEIVVSESGRSGTPKRPGRPIQTFLFVMLDENQKPGAKTERHFGLFNPDKSFKYEHTLN
uniref:glucan endo-1,3-beta-D-glucosidase n=1 Tax=Glycine max TaxID=3847 RepID=A0A0R0FPD3_SOYBN